MITTETEARIQQHKRITITTKVTGARRMERKYGGWDISFTERSTTSPSGLTAAATVGDVKAVREGQQVLDVCYEWSSRTQMGCLMGIQ